MRCPRGVGPMAAGAVLLALVIVEIGGRDAAAQAPASGAEQQLAQLRAQVTALERRITELEKKATGAGGAGHDTSAQDARLAQMEKRLAGLEQAERGPLDVRTPNSTLTAPFTIVDAGGKPILRVTDAAGQFSRGVYVFSASATGSGAHMGVLEDGSGRVYVAKAGNLPAALMGMAAEGPEFRLSADAKPMVRLTPGALSFLGTSGSTIALFGSKGDRAKGYLEINDGSGTKMVEAGSLDNHKGYVLASPYKTSTALTGDPSVLKGGGR